MKGDSKVIEFLNKAKGHLQVSAHGGLARRDEVLALGRDCARYSFGPRKRGSSSGSVEATIGRTD